jgi:hypothetical protein
MSVEAHLFNAILPALKAVDMWAPLRNRQEIADTIGSYLDDHGIVLTHAMSSDGPALRCCLVPGCLAQYDAIAALKGAQPARPSWSSEGWRILRSGTVFPAGGHVCPEHAAAVIEHLPRRVSDGMEWVQAVCDCGGWTSPRLRWHGAARGLWEEHLIDAAGLWEGGR